MELRTDLALEEREKIEGKEPPGVDMEKEEKGDAKICRIKILTRRGEKELNKPKGSYITVELSPLSDSSIDMADKIEIVAEEIKRLLPDGEILTVGLGNSEVTPDALGPLSAGEILATRHIRGEIARSIGFDDLRAVSVIEPGVLGNTGIESSEIIKGICDKTHPQAVIVIDALASRKLSRLGATIQISDTGISPGSGVGNHRKEISEKTIGVPVIAIGVPTVVDCATLTYDLVSEAGRSEFDFEKLRELIEPRGATMVVTPREIDLLVSRAARLVAMAINRALHPSIFNEDLLSLVS
jgi:spore protease